MQNKINADFAQRIVVMPKDYQWVNSPIAGVQRMMLDRIGNEIARATSLVSYAPGHSFTPHSHPGGEEFLVIKGVFCDESGRFPEGTYVRNPIGTKHAPFVEEQETIIFVKLHQFQENDRKRVICDTKNTPWKPTLNEGVAEMLLHEFQEEKIRLENWAPRIEGQQRQFPYGAELFVLKGELSDEHGTYPEGTWIRTPPQSRHTPYTSAKGATFYVKVGHLGEKLID